MKPLQDIQISVSPGEFVDKVTILQIKTERMTSPDQLANVRRELQLLLRAWGDHLPSSVALQGLTDELRQVNSELWEIEDAIRECERCRDFGAEFVALARSVYRTNDRRAELKRRINAHLGSVLVEEKSYSDYE